MYMQSMHTAHKKSNQQLLLKQEKVKSRQFTGIVANYPNLKTQVAD